MGILTPDEMANLPDKYTYEVKYLDLRDGTLRVFTCDAEDSGEAIDEVYKEEYYVGKILSVERA